MPIGTAVHERTFALCESLNYREWSGYYAVSAYEAHHEHEYNAIRNAAALFDVSPLFKYLVRGKDAAKFINRVIARDIEKVAVGQVIYCCWCDEKGKVIDDGTISRLGEETYRWTAAEPNLKWFTENARGMEVEIADISDQVAALSLQGPTSCRILKRLLGEEIARLKYFRVGKQRVAGVDVEISRTGYTGDLGYEIWIPWQSAIIVWDALMEAGQPYDIHPAGMLALDVARIEAGLILIDVEYTSSKRALIETQKYSPYEIGLGKLVNLKKENFVGKAALQREQKHGAARQLAGLNLDWEDIEKRYQAAGLAPQIAATASRAAVPVYRAGRQAGKATSTTWSPTLKRMIALAILNREHAAVGTKLEVELTVEAVRLRVGATVTELPFFNPPRKMATPAQ